MNTGRILLPDADSLRSLTQSLAMLEAILCPEFEYRYHRYDNHWGYKETMASLNNGSGDHVFIVFSAQGVWLKGFDHESPMSPHANDPVEVQPGVLDHVPKEFSAYLNEPAFMMEDTTFCYWSTAKDSTWQCGNPQELPNDGSRWLLNFYQFEPKDYVDWARGYHEKDLELAEVQHIFAHRSLTQSIVSVLNPELSLSDLNQEIATIGYPNIEL